MNPFATALPQIPGCLLHTMYELRVSGGYSKGQGGQFVPTPEARVPFEGANDRIYSAAHRVHSPSAVRRSIPTVILSKRGARSLTRRQGQPTPSPRSSATTASTQ